MGRYRLVRYEGKRLYDVGILPDGTLLNPNNYPEADVRAAVLAADVGRHQRRQEAAARAVATRKRRREKAVYRAAEDLKANKLTPGQTCRICGRCLGDPESIARGIGSECWGHVLGVLNLIATRTHRDADSRDIPVCMECGAVSPLGAFGMELHRATCSRSRSRRDETRV